ncbi:hypothetical protein [Kalamiella sp. sgz302252]|uniref:hypothetical protein n=1 Tax=Pantoea sp. sgz302252 TaxID=3341827 RepID=UPI0036D271C1
MRNLTVAEIGAIYGAGTGGDILSDGGNGATVGGALGGAGAMAVSTIEGVEIGAATGGVIGAGVGAAIGLGIGAYEAYNSSSSSDGS